MIVIDPRMTRTAAHATDMCASVRAPTSRPSTACLARLPERWEDKGLHRQRVYGFDEVRRRSTSGSPTRSSASPPAGGTGEARGRDFRKQKPSTLIWAMGQTQYTVETACARELHSCCSRPQCRSNVRAPTSFRGHDNVQGATDLGLDVTTLPLYYGLDGNAWRHWCRVWEVDYDWMQSRFASKTFMETAGISKPALVRRYAVAKDQVAQA